MKFFIDSANIKEIEEAVDLKIIDGVTTNPSLVAKSSNNIIETINAISKIIQGPISVEACAVDYEGILREGEKILNVADNIVLKLPITWTGLRACKYFYDQGREVNMTLCFNPLQALLAAKAGATYVSPFIGRLDDIGQNGIKLIQDIKKIFDHYSFYKTNILAASVRHIEHVLSSSLSGADAITLPLNIIKQLIQHPLTDKGVESFLNDWNKSGLTI